MSFVFTSEGSLFLYRLNVKKYEYILLLRVQPYVFTDLCVLVIKLVAANVLNDIELQFY